MTRCPAPFRALSRTSARAASLLGAILLAALTLGGCLPTKFVIDLDPEEGRLRPVQVLADDKADASSPRIALIEVTGVISHAPAGGGVFASSTNSVNSLVARLQVAEKDPTIKGVVLRINSPGGTVAASDTMYSELRRFREVSDKPIVASMGEVAASGGYYIALAADRLVAQPSSVTGSIGVLMQTINISKGLAKLGIEARALTSGPNKDLASPLEAVREPHYEILREMTLDFYEGFRAKVVEHRPQIPPAQLDAATDGRVFTGRQALAAGLVDELGGVRESFARAKQLAGLEHATLVAIVQEGRRPLSPYGALASSDAVPGTQINLVQLNADAALAPGAGFYYLWSPSVP